MGSPYRMGASHKSPRALEKLILQTLVSALSLVEGRFHLLTPSREKPNPQPRKTIGKVMTPRDAVLMYDRLLK